jgi:hypothetical protein
MIEQKANILWSFFAGRRDVYPLQKPTGDYFPEWQAVIKEVLLRHCKGQVTVGVYPIPKDDSVTLGALDFDAKTPEEFEIKKARIQEVVLFAKRWRAPPSQGRDTPQF